MSDNITGFGNGGATLVWVLAESHVVLHLWYEEGFATVDIHVCDYTSSNAAKAADLKQRMQELCFDAGECRWEELLIPHPSQASVMGAVPPSKALHR